MLKLSLLSGILGPFDCLFFQLTIIHKVNSYFLKTKQTTFFTQGKDENHLWCHLQQLTRVTTFEKKCHLNLLLNFDIFCSRQYAGPTFGRSSLDFCSAAFCSVSQTVDWFIRWILWDVFFSCFFTRGDRTSDFSTSSTGSCSLQLT